MARCFSSKKSKAGKRIKCAKCGHGIKPGERYYYFFKRFSRRVRGTRVTHCDKHKPRHVDLSSSKMAQVYDAQEDAMVGIIAATCLDDITSAVADLKTTVEEVKEEYEQSRSNMPDALQDVGSGAEIQEKVDALESYVSSLEEAESMGDDFLTDHEEESEEYEDEFEQWLQERRSEAEAAIDELSI